MLKILLLIVIVFAGLAILRIYQRSQNKPPPPPNKAIAEDMVKCGHCGVNLPRSEAIYSDGDFYCTPEHKQLGRE